jgi:hypothetical protein
VPESANALARSRAAEWVGLAAALAVLAALVARTSFLIDDAYISFRYARNWAETGVPNYNVGVAPPVEGYSNFLWVALLRGCYELGLDLELASRALGVAFAAATVVLLHRWLVRGLRVPPSAAALGAIALAAFPSFAIWSTGGLETSAFGFCVFALFVALSRPLGAREIALGGAAGLAALATSLLRIDGVAWSALALAVALLALERGQRRGALRRFAVCAAIAAAGLAAFLAWRVAVYGEWLPNTVHAKASLSSGTLVRGAKTSASYLLLHVTPLIAIAAAPLVARRPERRRALACAWMFVAFLAYDTLVGGDWMPFFRFLAPATPFLAVLAASELARLPARLRWPVGLAGIALAALPLFGVSLVPRRVLTPLYFRSFLQIEYESELERLQKTLANEERHALLGKALRQIAKPGDSITIGAIGAVGWHSGLVIHDRNGLVDREAARAAKLDPARTAGHDKQVPRSFFLARKPTFFEVGYSETPIGPEGSPSFRSRIEDLVKRVIFHPEESAARLGLHCVAEVHRLTPGDGIPPGACLIVLRATDDQRAAGEFWNRNTAPR